MFVVRTVWFGRAFLLHPSVVGVIFGLRFWAPVASISSLRGRKGLIISLGAGRECARLLKHVNESLLQLHAHAQLPALSLQFPAPTVMQRAGARMTDHYNFARLGRCSVQVFPSCFTRKKWCDVLRLEFLEISWMPNLAHAKAFLKSSFSSSMAFWMMYCDPNRGWNSGTGLSPIIYLISLKSFASTNAAEIWVVPQEIHYFHFLFLDWVGRTISNVSACRISCQQFSNYWEIKYTGIHARVLSSPFENLLQCNEEVYGQCTPRRCYSCESFSEI